MAVADPTVQDWLDRIVADDRARDWWLQIVWESREHYTCLRAGTKQTPMPFNKHKALEDYIRSALDVAEMRFRAVAENPQEKVNALTQQVALNYTARRAQLQRGIGTAILAARLDGYCGFKVQPQIPFGAVATPQGEGPSLVEPGNRKGEETEAADRAKMFAALRKAFPGSQPDLPLPFADLIVGTDLLWNRDAIRPQEARYILHKTRMTAARARELQRTGFFRQGKLTYRPTLPSTKMQIERHLTQTEYAKALKGNPGKGTDDHDLWEFLEIHDRENLRVLTILPGTDFVLRDVPEVLPGCPYQFLTFADNHLTGLPIPDVFHYMPAQQQLDLLLLHLTRHVAKFAKTIILTEKDITPESKKALAKAVNGEFLTVGDVNGIKELTLGQIPPAYFDIIRLLTQLIQEVAGVSAVSSGIASQPSTTAREIQELSTNTNVRLARMQKNLEECYEDIGQRQLQWLREVCPADLLVPVLGDDALDFEEWQADMRVAVTKDALATPVELDVVFGGGMSQEDMLGIKHIDDLWNYAMGSMMQTAPMGLPPMFQLRAIAEEMVRRRGLHPKHFLTPEAGMVQPPMPGMPPAPGGNIPMGRSPGENGVAVPPGAPEAPVSSNDARTRQQNPDVSREITDGERA